MIPYLTLPRRCLIGAYIRYDKVRILFMPEGQALPHSLNHFCPISRSGQDNGDIISQGTLRQLFHFSSFIFRFSYFLQSSCLPFRRHPSQLFCILSASRVAPPHITASRVPAARRCSVVVHYRLDNDANGTSPCVHMLCAFKT